MSSCISPGVISSSTHVHAVNKTTNAQLRKIKKPLIERRRRERINECLIQLKTLVLEAMNKDESRYSKMEKADILEMTVSHLKSLQKRLSYTSSSSSFLSSNPDSLLKSPSVKSDPLYRMETNRFQQDMLAQYLASGTYKDASDQKITSPTSNASQMNESRFGNSITNPDQMNNINHQISRPNTNANTQYANINVTQFESHSPIENTKCRSDIPIVASAPNSCINDINAQSQVSPVFVNPPQPTVPIRDITCSVSSTTDSMLYRNCGNRIILLSQVEISPNAGSHSNDVQLRDIWYSQSNGLSQPGSFCNRNQNFLCSIKNEVWRPW